MRSPASNNRGKIVALTAYKHTGLAHSTVADNNTLNWLHAEIFCYYFWSLSCNCATSYVIFELPSLHQQNQKKHQQWIQKHRNLRFLKIIQQEQRPLQSVSLLISGCWTDWKKWNDETQKRICRTIYIYLNKFTYLIGCATARNCLTTDDFFGNWRECKQVRCWYCPRGWYNIIERQTYLHYTSR